MDAQPEISRTRLRYGIISEGRFLEHWQAQCIEKLRLYGTFLDLVISLKADGLRGKSQKLQKKSIEKRLIPLDEIQHDVRTISIAKAHSDDDGFDLEEGDCEKIRGLELDFIVHFAKGMPQGRILDAARLGVWVYRHGKSREEPLCFWEVYRDEAITPVFLERIYPLPNPPVQLWTGRFRTIRSSYTRNLDQALAGSMDWLAKACTKITNGDSGLGSAKQEDSTGIPLQTEAPSNSQTWLLSLKTAKRRVQAVLRTAFRYTTWNVGIVEAPIQSFLVKDFKPRVRWLPQSRKGHIQADPFGRKNGENVRVLFERLDYLHRKGVICTVDLHNGNPVAEPTVVIEEPVHMSYPYIFEYDHETYCIPETNQAREVAVYRALNFPSQWERTGRRLLTGIRAIDTTIFKHEDLWWMTFTDRDRGGDANLYAWYAPDLWGPWTAHPLNPVKTDVRSARPGGTPFMHEGRLYRPAQDCSKTGGGQIVLNRVDKLSPTQFEEVPVATVGPFQDSVYKAGMHTLSAVGGYTLVDGKRFRFVPSGLLSNAVRGIRRMTGTKKEATNLPSR